MMTSKELLSRAIEAQGGLAAWEGTERLEVSIAADGFAFTTHMRFGGLARTRATVETRGPRVRFDGYPDERMVGVFDGEADLVRIQSADGESLRERANPRAHFFGLSGLRRNFRWDDLDFLYFCGYALWSYLTVPFVLRDPGFEIDQLKPADDRGTICHRLLVRYPANLPAHSREQVVWLDPDGLITRLDYTAEVMGGWAKAANLVTDRAWLGGLLLPSRRLVIPQRPGGTRTLPRPQLVRIAVDPA